MALQYGRARFPHPFPGMVMKGRCAYLLASSVLASPAMAQNSASDYPGKSVKIIVNVSPGGGVDTNPASAGEWNF